MLTKKQKKQIRLFWMIIATPVVLLLLFLLGIGLFAYIPSFEDLEDPKSNLATEVISSDGVILGTFHVENRTYVSYSDLSPNLEHALLATEDIRFYSHSGIDFVSLGRVAFKTILSGDRRSGGGSTITQQLALNLYSERSSNKFHRIFVQKPQEWITAIKLERNYTKQEIIAMYFNTVLFGSNAYGIRSAAVTFFGKHPSQVNIQEAAMLIGVINAPTLYSPVRNPDRALQRRNHVLSQMKKYGYITAAACDSLIQLPIELSFSQQDHLSGLAPYFRDMLRRTMMREKPDPNRYTSRHEYTADSAKWENDPITGWIHKNTKADGSRYNIDRDGLKIYTTIDSRMQRYAEWAVEEHLKTDLQPLFSVEVRRRRHPPFSNDLTSREIESIMRQAKRRTDRYRLMKTAGKSDAEIEKSFKTKTNMTVFSWKGDIIDTVMTPNDSILYYKSILRASLVAMEPETGNIRAYVGGPNYRYFRYDNASQGKRQVGSTMKPFLYTLAMQEGMMPCDRVLNVPQTFIVGDTTWTPKTTDKPEWIGKHVSLKWGLTKSSNYISAYLMKQYGPQALVDISHKIGIKSDLPGVYALCLGACDLNPWEMVGAYNTYPSKGVFIEPFFVVRIEDKDGNVLTTPFPIKREALSPQTAYLMTNLMQGVVNEGTAYRLRSRYVPEGQIAGKTGTTDNHSDGWFVGYMPKLTAGVWVGAEDRSVHFQSIALGGGANMALPIWGLFMQKVLADPSLNTSTTDVFAAPTNLVMNLNCDGSDDDISSNDIRTNDDFFN